MSAGLGAAPWVGGSVRWGLLLYVLNLQYAGESLLRGVRPGLGLRG